MITIVIRILEREALYVIKKNVDGYYHLTMFIIDDFYFWNNGGIHVTFYGPHD